ncbi:MAG: antitoxin family protein [Nitrospinae bacterium]|nr:antitoxin family protein [Nitrospinota bacterium]
MSRVIDAIFENGVFKPLSYVEVKEHEKIAIKIISLDEWHNRFNRIIEKIHKKAAQYTHEEIEADISLAVKESRKEKYGNKSNSLFSTAIQRNSYFLSKIYKYHKTPSLLPKSLAIKPNL